jgi:hypothetical protein
MAQRPPETVGTPIAADAEFQVSWYFVVLSWRLLRHQVLDFLPRHRRQVLGDQRSMAVLGAAFGAQ